MKIGPDANEMKDRYEYGLLAEEIIGYMDGPILCVGMKNVSLPYSPKLKNYILLNEKNITQAVSKLCLKA